jgi:hypothetical protein
MGNAPWSMPSLEMHQYPGDFATRQTVIGSTPGRARHHLGKTVAQWISAVGHLRSKHELLNSPAQEMLLALTTEPHAAPFLVTLRKIGSCDQLVLAGRLLLERH